MENFELVEKLKNKANVSYEDAKTALEKSNWDILDAIVYLEELDKVPRPSISTYFTNDSKRNYEKVEDDYKDTKKENHFGGFFETVCEIIDKCNNIFFEIRRENKVVIKLPLTVMILLIIFAFWIIIPIAIVGLFFDVEFSLSGQNIEKSKVNDLFSLISDYVRKIKDNIKKG